MCIPLFLAIKKVFQIMICFVNKPAPSLDKKGIAGSHPVR